VALSAAQWKTLKRLGEAGAKGCEYTHVLKVGGNGHTLRCLVDMGLARMEKTFGTKFWYVTDAGISRSK
jgi:hypothetical protein